ncbi:Ldh family oxidoreductase [Salinicola peritrichatus]|uniref:Ldh family oxidoreductase n=1 Tax=Salinicola peritrichatus TaxID=1267424 RepID=UPI000DA164BC|nr:Ldh family oxidoreductase [Salinicola peritrichatus]
MFVNVDKVSQFAIACLTKCGMSAEDADIVAQTLIVADQKGIHSHGFMRLPVYIQRIKKNMIVPDAQVETVRETESTVVADGHYGAGQVVGYRTMAMAIDKARHHGAGVAVVKNSNHFGIAGHFAQMAADQNMIGVVISNVEPLMPAVGGAEKVIGNNPIAIAAPSSGETPVILDMALSHVPLGKILFTKSQGKDMPEGWGLDKNGAMTTDPAQVHDGESMLGSLFPTGGAKGFGLALMTEVLTGVLSGGEFSKQIASMYAMEERQSISHFMLALDIAQFMDITEFKQRMLLLAGLIKSSARAEGVEELFLPGEIEQRWAADNLDKGLPMDQGIYDALQALGQELGVEFNV